MAETVHAIEDVWDVWDYHLDQDNDVLYLAFAGKVGEASFGEETDEGLILRRSMADDAVTGLTIISFWKFFGAGPLAEVSQVSLESAMDRFLAGLRPPLADEINRAVAEERGKQLPKAKTA